MTSGEVLSLLQSSFFDSLNKVNKDQCCISRD